MSRLDSFIARMQAQRLLLDHICALLDRAGDALPGPVLELGLGNGRTYDHLRSRLGNRRIVAFDKRLVANPASVPPEQDLILGGITTTAATFASSNGSIAALVHADLGSGQADYEAELRSWLPDLAQLLLRTGGWALSSTELDHANLEPQPLPAEVPSGRYFMYRKV